MSRKRKAAIYVHDSDDEDASYEPQNLAEEDEDDWKPSKNNVTTKGKKRKKRDASDAEYISKSEAHPSADISQTRPHPITLHVLSRPEPTREALVRWYEGVHASRGMPWRKSYDHNWDREQKAQRAYEVGP